MARGTDSEHSELYRVSVLVYIAVVFFLKYSVLFGILQMMVFTIIQVYSFSCKSFMAISKFFSVLLKPPKLRLFGMKFTNFFSIIDAFLSLLIGVLYAIISIALLVGVALLSIPFNFTLAYEI